LRHKVIVLPSKREKQLATSPASTTGGDATPQGE
jgi:hypothetical protein